jgi:hypothetical protein
MYSNGNSLCRASVAKPCEPRSVRWWLGTGFGW